MSLDPKIYIVPVGHGMAAMVNDGEHVIIVDFGVEKTIDKLVEKICSLKK